MIALKKILVQLLYFNALDRKSILLLLDDVEDRNIYFALKKGVRDNLIEERKALYTRDKRNYTSTYFILTAHGFDYILEDEEIGIILPWLANANIPYGKLSIVGRKDGSALGKEMLKYLRITYAAIMAMKVGAKVNPMYYDMMDYFGLERYYKAHGSFGTADDMFNDVEVVDDNGAPQKPLSAEALPSSVNKVNHLSSIVMKAKIAYDEFVKKVNEEEEKRTGNKSKDDKKNQKSETHNELVFRNSSEVRNIHLNNVYSRQKDPENLRSDIIQSRTCQMSGILDAGDRIYFVFTEPPFGMSWMITSTSPDMMLYRTYLNEIHSDMPTSKNLEHIGFFLVRTPDEFYRNFYDHYYRRTTEIKEEEDSEKKKKKRVQRDPFSLGREFNSLYMIPVDDNGVELMKNIIFYDVESRESDMVQWGMSNGLERADRIDNARVFTLHDKRDDSYLFYGGLMDIVKMNSLARTLANHPKLKVKIFCIDWQESYYKKLFPNAEIILP